MPGEEFTSPHVDAIDPAEMASNRAPGNSVFIMHWPWFRAARRRRLLHQPRGLLQIPEDLPAEPPDAVLETSDSTPGEPQSLLAMPQMPKQFLSTAETLPPSVPQPTFEPVQAQEQSTGPAPEELQLSLWPQPPLRPTLSRQPRPVRPCPVLFEAQHGWSQFRRLRPPVLRRPACRSPCLTSTSGCSAHRCCNNDVVRKRHVQDVLWVVE